MDREKIIKEMEAILEQEQIKIANTVEEFAKLQKVGIARCNAEALYNANCQVIPEGAVVLTKEEYERLRSVENDLQRYTIKLYNRAREAEDKIDQISNEPDKIPQKIKDFYKWFIEIEKELARKEMAREIFSELFDNMQVDSENGCKVYVFEAKEFKKIAKKRGAEVEEMDKNYTDIEALKASLSQAGPTYSRERLQADIQSLSSTGRTSDAKANDRRTR